MYLIYVFYAVLHIASVLRIMHEDQIFLSTIRRTIHCSCIVFKEITFVFFPVVNLQGEISALQEKVSSLERERENLEDDLDDREAEIVELKTKIEQLETENKEKGKDILNYKSQLDLTNEEIKSVRIKMDESNSGTRREDEESLNKRIKDYEAMIDKLTKEISSLQGKLSAANQLNKDLEKKVKSSMQVWTKCFLSLQWKLVNTCMAVCFAKLFY